MSILSREWLLFSLYAKLDMSVTKLDAEDNTPIAGAVFMEKENNNIIFTIENPMSDSSEIDCNRLFDRFYTGDKSRHNGSTGLGLFTLVLYITVIARYVLNRESLIPQFNPLHEIHLPPAY